PLSDGRTADALLQARAAHDRDPLALEPLFDISEIEDAAGHRDFAQRTLEEAVRLQPANPESWRQLANYQLNTLNQPGPAFAALRAALFLDPQSPAVRAEFLDAYRRLPRQPAKPRAKPSNPVAGAIRKELQRNKPSG